MPERRLLMTLDEAREAFAASALNLASILACSRERTFKLLRGEGRTTGLSARQRAEVLEHKRLLNALNADGLDNVVGSELEGLAAYLEMEQPESSSAAS
jgi:hypothetical protein